MGSGLRGDGLEGDIRKAPVCSQQRGIAGWAVHVLPVAGPSAPPTGQHPARHMRGRPLRSSKGNRREAEDGGTGVRTCRARGQPCNGRRHGALAPRWAATSPVPAEPPIRARAQKGLSELNCTVALSPARVSV